MKVTYHYKAGLIHSTSTVEEPDDTTDEELQQNAENRAIENIDIWFEKE